MPAMTGHGRQPIRRASPMSMRRTERPSVRSLISQASPESLGRGLWRLSRAGREKRRDARLLLGIRPQALLRTGCIRTSADLYRIEDDIRGQPADECRPVRQERSQPIIADLEPWLREKLGLISQKTKLAEAIRYTLSRWEGLTRFLDDRRIEIDSNTVERSIRPIALNRKNVLFAGSDGGAEDWAVIAALIETALCRARHKQVYADRRTMPSEQVFTNTFLNVAVAGSA